MTVEVKVKLLSQYGRLPVFTRDGDACADLLSADAAGLWPGETRVIYTDIAIEIPPGYEGLVRGRSGLASKGAHVHAGTVDATYRGNVGIVVFNASRVMLTISRGDRVAQLAVREVPSVRFAVADELSDTSRGTSGFGSSGLGGAP